MNKKETTSIRIDPELWHEFKIYCVIKRKDISEVIEEMVKKELKNKI